MTQATQADDTGEARTCTIRAAALKVEASSIDLSGTCVLEICIPLYEHERAECEFETWPGPIKLRAVRELNAWRNRNARADIVMMSTSVAKRCCVLLIHAKT